jgi:uncharacterized membrane protein
MQNRVIMPASMPGTRMLRTGLFRLGLPMLLLSQTAVGTCANLILIDNPFNYAISPRDVSWDGSAACGSVRISITESRPYVWNAVEGLTTIGTHEGTGYALSATGKVMAIGMGRNGSVLYHAARWTHTEGATYLGTFGSATAITSDGMQIIGSTNAKLFRWTAETGVRVIDGYVGPSVYDAVASADGVMIGFTGSFSDGSFFGYRYTDAGGFQRLPTLGGPTFVYGISADGSTIVGRAHSGTSTNRPVYWFEGGAAQVLETPFNNGTATDASEDGSVIVGDTQISADDAAIRWRHGTWDLLNETYASEIPTGWSLRTARAITPDGSSPVSPFEETNNEHTSLTLCPSLLVPSCLSASWCCRPSLCARGGAGGPSLISL